MLSEIIGGKAARIEASDLMLALTASVLAVAIGLAIRLAYEVGLMEGSIPVIVHGSFQRKDETE